MCWGRACPLILIGTGQPKPLLLKNPQFKERCHPPVFLDPLDLSIPEEKEMFLDHCAGFDLNLVKNRIFPRPSGLITDDITPCMYDVRRGVIGTASNLFEEAAEPALRRGDDRIRRDDLSTAVRTWAIPLEITNHKPFETGARRLRATRAA